MMGEINLGLDVTKDMEKALPEHSPVKMSPFHHQCAYPWWWWCLVAVVGPVLVPLRLISLIVVFLANWTLARIALTAAPETRPLAGWRRTLQTAGFTGLHLLVTCMGVVVRTSGHQADRGDCPILVVAPHSTLVDWAVCGVARASPVAKVGRGPSSLEL